jgi:probable phosphoglycerate mutase
MRPVTIAFGAVALLGVIAPLRLMSLASDTTEQARSAGVLRLYLARHGQTDWNLEGRLQGSSDVPLNRTGQQQAALLAERLSGIDLDAVYSSELQRSRETAHVVHGLAPVTALAGLNERRLGVFEGQLTSPEYVRRSRDLNDTLGGGESLSQLFTRVKATLADILSRHRSGAILIVGHLGTNQMLVGALFGLSPEQAVSFQQANDELYLCELVSGRAARFWKLVMPPG